LVGVCVGYTGGVVGVGVRVGGGEKVGTAVGVLVGGNVRVGIGDGVRVGVGVNDGVAVALGDGVGVTDAVLVADGEGVADGCGVGGSGGCVPVGSGSSWVGGVGEVKSPETAVFGVGGKFGRGMAATAVLAEPDFASAASRKILWGSFAATTTTGLLALTSSTSSKRAGANRGKRRRPL